MPEPPKILTRKQVNDSFLFKVDRVELAFSNGELRTYEYLKAGEHAAVIVVPLLDDDTVIFVEEYGAGVNRYELCLPKGKVDEGESFEEAALRELKEEAGFGARELVHIKSMSQSPNYMEHETQVILARGLYEEKLKGDEPEDLIVHRLPFNNLTDIILRPEVTEARTIAALLLAQQWIKLNK
ncbi:MAG: ADP compounds hydrolase NudE [Agarilytica sp.]